MFLGQLGKFSPGIAEVLVGDIPLAAPAVSELGDTIDEEHVKFLIGLFIDEG